MGRSSGGSDCDRNPITGARTAADDCSELVDALEACNSAVLCAAASLGCGVSNRQGTKMSSLRSCAIYLSLSLGTQGICGWPMLILAFFDPLPTALTIATVVATAAAVT